MTQETFDDKFGTDADFEEPAVEKGIREQKEIAAKVDAEEAKKNQQDEYAKKLINEYGEKFDQADGVTKLAAIDHIAKGAAAREYNARKGTANVDSQVNTFFADSPEFGKKFRGSKVLTGRVEKAMRRFDGDVTRALDSVIQKLSDEELEYLNKPKDSEDTGSW